MKNLFFLLFLSITVISCKKKEQTENTPYSVSKGDFLMIVVSDSVEYARECKEDNFSSSSLKESPVFTDFEFTNGNYRVSIYPYGIGMYGLYYFSPTTGFAVDFPQFGEYYSNTFVDSIPGNQLEKHQVYSVPLDTSKIDYLVTSIPEEVESGWDKIKDLRLVYEYRMKFPDSQIGFLHVKKEDGEAKSYFFMNKYKP